MSTTADRQLDGRDADLEASRAEGHMVSETTREFLRGVARGFGGAVFFGLPLMMTMEMWWLGFYMDPLRLAVLLVVFFPIILGLSHYAGFEQTRSWVDDLLDAAVAYLVGAIASTAVLWMLHVIDSSMPAHELVGKIALQTIPAAFGAVLATAQFGSSGGAKSGENGSQQRKHKGGYGTEIFLMLAGAVFLAFNVAPTEEMVLIAYKMTHWHALATLVATVLMMHAFVYAVAFKGTERVPESTSGWSVFARYTVVGYVLCLVASAYILWTFGRFETASPALMLHDCIVLGLPAGIGASIARLVL